jgi:hypothetical protein
MGTRPVSSGQRAILTPMLGPERWRQPGAGWAVRGKAAARSGPGCLGILIPGHLLSEKPPIDWRFRPGAGHTGALTVFSRTEKGFRRVIVQ